MEDDDIQMCFEYALPLIREAGQVILQAENVVLEFKKDITDIVTEYDRKVEQTLIDKLKNKFPHHKFIGEEESFAHGNKLVLTDDPTWIIDPIDGTTNFVRKLSMSCISVGVSVKKDLCLGIIYNPFHDEMYWALKGRGAFLNGNKIQTSKCTDIKHSVINYELSLARDPRHFALYLYRYQYLIQIIHGMRSLGCASLGLCYVACGKTDAYQCDGLKPWDVAAGAVIVREAGGFICDSTGKELDFMNPNFLATATKTLSDQYVEVEQKADADRLAGVKLPISLHQ